MHYAWLSGSLFTSHVPTLHPETVVDSDWALSVPILTALEVCCLLHGVYFMCVCVGGQPHTTSHTDLCRLCFSCPHLHADRLPLAYQLGDPLAPMLMFLDGPC